MGFWKLSTDSCSNSSHKPKINHFELILEYQNEQKSLLLSVVGHKHNTSTLHNTTNGKLVENCIIQWK